MPNREIRESCRSSETLAQLTAGAERFFWRLTTSADDFGRFDARPAVLRAECFKVMLAKITEAQVIAWLKELLKADLVRVYTQDGKVYGYFVTWPKHQRKRAKYSKYPVPPADDDTCRQMTAYAAVSSIEAVRSRIEAVSSEETEDNTTTSRGSSPRAVAVAVDWSIAEWPSPEALVHLYNEMAPDNVPAVETLSEKRKARARQVLRLMPARAWWIEVFEEYQRSRFLSGKSPPSPEHKGFRPDFDWLLSTSKTGTENYVKVHDGGYR